MNQNLWIFRCRIIWVADSACHNQRPCIEANERATCEDKLTSLSVISWWCLRNKLLSKCQERGCDLAYALLREDTLSHMFPDLCFLGGEADSLPHLPCSIGNKIESLQARLVSGWRWIVNTMDYGVAELTALRKLACWCFVLKRFQKNLPRIFNALRDGWRACSA